MIDRPAQDAAEPTGDAAIVHPLGAGASSSLARWLERWSHPPHFRPLVSAIPLPVSRVSAPPDALATATAGLGEGAARAEAVAVRLRRLGLHLELGAADPVAGPQQLLAACRARGESSIDLIRADPSLVPQLQVGSWFHSSSRMRALRLALLRLPLHAVAVRPVRLLALLCDVAFWSGVHSAATATEWRRLTGSSYVSLYYHQISSEPNPGQERLVVTPATFRRQMRLLRLLRFRPLSPGELVRFHSDPQALLPRRSYVVTADDAFADTAAELAAHLAHRPHVYVPTGAVGGTASWAGNERITGWDELRALQQGGAVVASHGRTHAVLTELVNGARDSELTASLQELRARLEYATPFLAYPHGRHDAGVRAAAQRAGYRLAYTTRPGRNGAGTDPYCLRRIGIKDWDRAPSFVWKLVSGEHAPPLRRRAAARRDKPT